MKKSKDQRRAARKARGAGPPPSGAVARMKAEILAAKTREEKLSAGMKQYMDAAEAAVAELNGVADDLRRENQVLRATADTMAEALRSKFVRLAPTMPGQMEGIENLLKPGCDEIQAFQVADSTFVLFLAGVPTDADRLEAMGRMIRDFGERHGVGILPMSAPPGKSVAEAFGLYRLEIVSTGQSGGLVAVEAGANGLSPGVEPLGGGNPRPPAELRPLAPGEVWTPEPGTIADPAAYEAALADGTIAEIPPGDPRATAAASTFVTVDQEPPPELLDASRPS